jgi:hypothetical protein
MMKKLMLFLIPFLTSQSFAQQKQPQKKNFAATLTVKAITVKTSFNGDGQVEAKEETEQQYTVKQGLRFYSDLLQRLDAKTQKLNLCTSESSCVLLNGTSRALDENQPISFAIKSTFWGMCNEKLIVNRVEEGNGTLTDYNVGTMISVIRRTKDDLPEAVPLTDERDVLDGVEAAPLVNPDFYIRLFVNIGGISPNINPSAPKMSGKYYDCSMQKWIDIEPSKYGLSIPDFYVLRRNLKTETTDLGTQFYRSPIFKDNELLNFLRKGSGGKTFSFEVKDNFKSNTEETNTTIYINMEFH